MVCQKCQNLMVVLSNTDPDRIGDIIDPFAFTGENSKIWYCTRCGHIAFHQ